MPICRRLSWVIRCFSLLGRSCNLSKFHSPFSNEWRDLFAPNIHASVDSKIPRIILTNFTAISSRRRAVLSTYFEISIWLFGTFRWIAIPWSDDAIVVERSIVGAHCVGATIQKLFDCGAGIISCVHESKAYNSTSLTKFTARYSAHESPNTLLNNIDHEWDFLFRFYFFSTNSPMPRSLLSVDKFIAQCCR